MEGISVRSKILTVFAFTVLALLTTGCGSGNFLPQSPTSSPLRLNGKVHGGQNPVAGASVYVYAAGTSGYGGASVSLLGPSGSGNWPTHQDGNGNYYVTTDSNGNFGLTGDYTCTAGQQVYLYAVGGNPGAGTNSSDGFLAVLGNCPGGDFSSIIPNVIVNEVTTVAAAYAMAGYATDATHVSSPSRALALTGIANAFANAANLVNISSGTARTTTPAGNGTVPTQTINTLANILATCVNSADQTGPFPGPSTNCNTLFTADYSNGSQGSAAGDTATLAIYIAHNPGNAVNLLFSQSGGSPPFGNGLNQQPNDFSLGINFTSSGFQSLCDLAIDAAGNAWVVDMNNNAVTQLSNLGAVVHTYTSGTMVQPYSVAINASGNVWVGTIGDDQIYVFNTGGALVGNSPYRDSGHLLNVVAISLDASGNAWVSDAGFPGNIAKLDSGGNQLLGNVVSPAGMNDADGSAVDAAGHFWFASDNAQKVFVMDSNGNPVGSSPFSVTNSTPVAVAMDASGNAWVAEAGGGVDEYNPGSSGAPTASYTTSIAQDGFNSIAVDGSGNVWTASYRNSYILELGSNASPVPNASFTPASIFHPASISIDGSGDLWLSSFGSTTVTEVIGIATPVVTPIVANLISPYSHPASLP